MDRAHQPDSGAAAKDLQDSWRCPSATPVGITAVDRVLGILSRDSFEPRVRAESDTRHGGRGADARPMPPRWRASGNEQPHSLRTRSRREAGGGRRQASLPRCSRCLPTPTGARSRAAAAAAPRHQLPLGPVQEHPRARSQEAAARAAGLEETLAPRAAPHLQGGAAGWRRAAGREGGTRASWRERNSRGRAGQTGMAVPQNASRSKWKRTAWPIVRAQAAPRLIPLPSPPPARRPCRPLC